ncbi:unnamed protein product [Rhizoctonia solani]|uniref:Uncharacterized protein n=1 Tax=Rhizoctonia solani TaxID=456999 RepID=A0A8H2WIM2_9AGAM|nr:unnamed protein product [Rhizoctonia solani]
MKAQSEGKDKLLVVTCFVEHFQGGERMILPEIGGFYKEDAEYLLEKLWENRVAFLQASGILSWQGTPGWSALLAIIWHYMRQTDNSTLPLKRLRNLILRYAMSAPRPECYLLEDMVVAIEKHLPPPTPGNEELPPVDEYDVEFMGEVFMRYLDVPLALKEGTRASCDLMGYPFGLVYHNTLTTLPDRAPSLLSAVIERVWGILEETGSKFTPQERILHSFDYALNAITSMSLALRLLDNYSDHDQTIETATVVWTELLRNVNILELVGRLCSIIAISTNNSGSELLICPARLEYFMKSTRRLMAELKDIIQVHALENLNELSHMWHKVFRHIERHLSLYPPGGPVQHRAKLCRSIWLEVGETFDFFPQTTEPDIYVPDAVGYTTAPGVVSRYTGMTVLLADTGTYA